MIKVGFLVDGRKYRYRIPCDDAYPLSLNEVLKEQVKDPEEKSDES
ncbi:MAG: hypothetical protein WD492_03245 [Alkalispirochaeta sp.]